MPNVLSEKEEQKSNQKNRKYQIYKLTYEGLITDEEVLTYEMLCLKTIKNRVS